MKRIYNSFSFSRLLLISFLLFVGVSYSTANTLYLWYGNQNNNPESAQSLGSVTSDDNTVSWIITDSHVIQGYNKYFGVGTNGTSGTSIAGMMSSSESDYSCISDEICTSTHHIQYYGDYKWYRIEFKSGSTSVKVTYNKTTKGLTFDVGTPSLQIGCTPEEYKFNDSVTLTVANGTGPYQWYISTDDGATFTEMTGETGVSINVIAGNSTVYKCVDSESKSSTVTIYAEMELECDSENMRELFKDDFGKFTMSLKPTGTNRKIYFMKPDDWPTAYCYAYKTSNGNKIFGDWPGREMTGSEAGYAYIAMGASDPNDVTFVINNGDPSGSNWYKTNDIRIDWSQNLSDSNTNCYLGVCGYPANAIPHNPFLIVQKKRTSNSYTKYNYVGECGKLSDSKQYAVVATPKWAGCHGSDGSHYGNTCNCGYYGGVTFWYRTDDFYDHTGTDAKRANGEYGGMLMLNCDNGSSSDNDILYERTATGLCKNTYTKFSMYIANAAKADSKDPIKLKFILWNSSKSVKIAEKVVDGLVFDAGWQEVSTMFNTGDNESVVLQVINKAAAGANGNDVLLDDLLFQACTPETKLYADIEEVDGKLVPVCGVPFTLRSAVNAGALPTPYYIWQVSTDGTSWSRVSDSSAGSGLAFQNLDVIPDGSKFYRVIIANDKGVAESVESGGTTGACGLYSITNTVNVVCNDIAALLTISPDEVCKGVNDVTYTFTVSNPTKAVYATSWQIELPDCVDYQSYTSSDPMFAYDNATGVWSVPTLGATDVTLTINVKTNTNETSNFSAKAFLKKIDTKTYTTYNDAPTASKDSKGLKINALPTASSSNVVNNTRCTSPYNGEYTITATGGSGTYTYSNDGGASYSSTATYPGLQSASVTAKVKDSNGCVSEGVSISVSDNSHAPIQYSVINGGFYCSDGDGMPVGLSKSETGFTYTLFRNGESTGISLPGTGNELKFGKQTAAGRYTAKAENATTGCSADMQGFTDVAIDPKPTNNAGTNQEECNTTDFTLAGTATGNVSTWTIKSYDGTTNPTIENPTSLTSKVTGVELGKTVVLTLTTTSTHGLCTDATSEVSLTNKDCTSLTLTVTADSPICAGGTSNYKIEVYNGSTVKATGVTVSYKKPGDTTPYTWTIGDIAAGGKNTKSEQYTPASTAASTTVNVSAYVSAVNGISYATYEASEAKDKKDIKVNALPTISYKVYKGSTEDEMSSPYTITCTDQSARVVLSGGATYKWSDNKTEAERIFTDAANLTVKSVSAEGCESSNSETIEITKNTSTPNVSVTPTSGTIDCTTTSITLTASSTTEGVTYKWNDASSTTGSTLTVSDAGTYTVTATATNGCTNTASATITKSTEVPNVSVTPTSGTIDCTTTSITLTASSTTEGVTYKWNDASSTTGSTLTVSDAGTYTVTATATNGCTNTASA
ncbi:MAG: starch-binding protein, partial [Paludibacteraceae bacterium]|nr:starch-binding protein [Paludibacteraceae bacterium]